MIECSIGWVVDLYFISGNTGLPLGHRDGRYLHRIDLLLYDVQRRKNRKKSLRINESFFY